MPSVSENTKEWNAHTWDQQGDEWSGEWGGARAQWFGSLLPRVFPFLNRGRILEIASGQGRWTQFLANHGESLVGVDMSDKCVAHCKVRFEKFRQTEFFVNDGLTLPMVEDDSIDFAFSFDSLVHAQPDVLASYIRELSRKLKPRGVGFIHHSNLGATGGTVWASSFRSKPSTMTNIRWGLVEKVRRRLSGLPFEDHWRDESMTAELMRSFCESNGMSCVQQELVPWGNGWPLPIDCLSTFVNESGRTATVFHNSRFMEEARTIKRISTLNTSENHRPKGGGIKPGGRS
jgi:SAM-dependent methyltransferase